MAAQEALAAPVAGPVDSSLSSLEQALISQGPAEPSRILNLLEGGVIALPEAEGPAGRKGALA